MRSAHSIERADRGFTVRLALLASTLIAGLAILAASAGSASAEEVDLDFELNQVTMNVGAFKGLPVITPEGDPATLTAQYDAETGEFSAEATDFQFPSGLFDIANAVAPGIPGEGSTLTVGFSAVPDEAGPDITGTFDEETGETSLDMDAKAQIILNMTGDLAFANGTCQLAPIPMALQTTGMLEISPGDPEAEPPVPPTGVEGKPFAAGEDGTVVGNWESLPAAADDPTAPDSPCAGAELVNLIAGGAGGIAMGGTATVEQPPPTCEQDPSQPGCEQPPPTCEQDPSQPRCQTPPPPPGKGAVSIGSASLKSKKLGAGKSTALKVTVRNTGDGSANGVEVCAKVPKKSAKKLKAKPGCKTVGTLAAGASKTVKFKLKAKKKAKGKVKVGIEVSSSDAGSASRSAKVKIKR